jgi:hypothetical protein
LLTLRVRSGEKFRGSKRADRNRRHAIQSYGGS